LISSSAQRQDHSAIATSRGSFNIKTGSAEAPSEAIVEKAIEIPAIAIAYFISALLPLAISSMLCQMLAGMPVITATLLLLLLKLSS
jgi:hypothetical protein